MFVLLIAATNVLAQEQLVIEVTVKDTVFEQFQLAKTVMHQAASETVHSEKLRLTATAIETLEVIPRRWPSEHEWLVAAAIAESDLFAGTNAPRDALRVLLRAEPFAKAGTPNTARLLLRVGKINAELQNDSAALPYLLRADAEALRSDHEIQFGVDLALSGVYSRTGNFTEAAKRFRRLATADRIHDPSRTSFSIQAARHWAQAGQQHEAEADLDRADAFIAKAKSSSRDENETHQQRLFEDSVKQLRDKLKKPH